MNFDIRDIQGTYYGKPEDTCYTITANEYNELLKAKQLLDALTEYQVADWCWFDSAVELAAKWDEEDK